MKDQLVEAGRARAASVGWPDAYAFTKALGEQALTGREGDVPVSIVRPSIIESALAEPKPGWIRGFRMAEPVIISYARGLLSEFPGVPEGTVDVIPVDLVVAAIIAVAALGPEQAPPIAQVASGGINPLQYRTLVDNASGWFREHPLYDAEGQPIVVPEWHVPRTWPGAGAARPGPRRCSPRREGAAAAAAPWQAGRVGRPDRDQADGDRAGARPTSSSTGSTPSARRSTRSTTCWRSGTASTPTDRADFNFDPRIVDWPTYITRDPPAVDRPARPREDHAGQSSGTDRMDALRKQVLDPKRQVVAFDLENTLIASNVVESYSWLATRRLDTRRAGPLRRCARWPRRRAC